MTNREKAELTYRAIQERKMRKANKKLISDVSKYLIEINGKYLFANNKEIAEKSSAYIQGYETDLEPRIMKFLDRFIGSDKNEI